MSLWPDASLRSLVRRRKLNFEQLAEALSTRGYVIEDTEPLRLGSVIIERARQDDFDALFAVLCPDAPAHDIELSKAATDKGGIRGAFPYAVFNETLIPRDEMMKLLIEFNETGGVSR